MEQEQNKDFERMMQHLKDRVAEVWSLKDNPATELRLSTGNEFMEDLRKCSEWWERHKDYYTEKQQGFMAKLLNRYKVEIEKKRKKVEKRVYEAQHPSANGDFPIDEDDEVSNPNSQPNYKAYWQSVGQDPKMHTFDETVIPMMQYTIGLADEARLDDAMQAFEATTAVALEDLNPFRRLIWASRLKLLYGYINGEKVKVPLSIPNWTVMASDKFYPYKGEVLLNRIRAFDLA